LDKGCKTNQLPIDGGSAKWYRYYGNILAVSCNIKHTHLSYNPIIPFWQAREMKTNAHKALSLNLHSSSTPSDPNWR
jgi:hypothetical protein